jgi:hypothetical protein
VVPLSAQGSEAPATPTWHPIIFTGWSVPAILAGRKTQTRRLLKPGRFVLPNDAAGWTFNGAALVREESGGTSFFPLPFCPYGAAGDRLWVRENWRTVASLDHLNATGVAKAAAEAGWDNPWCPVVYEADGRRINWDCSVFGKEAGRPRRARFMPRWLSRATVVVTEVRVQRLQDITDDDAQAEGCSGVDTEPANEGGTIYAWKGRSSAASPRAHFAHRWAGINGAASWESNAWVWVISFRMLVT